jgi:periplasmic protein TonB
VKLRTILNIDVIGPHRGGVVLVEEVRPARGLFRMGEAARGEGEWERWGWAVLLAALLHVGTVLVAISLPRAVPKAPAPPEEPELVLLTFIAPQVAAPSAPQAPEAQPRIPPKARTRPPRPLVTPPVPTPVPEKAPEPREPETPAPEEDSAVAEDATGVEVVGGVVAGLVDSAMSTPGGTGLGVSGGEAVDLKQVSRPPSVLEQVQPQYPRQARSRGIEGLVLVRIIIGTDGRVEPEHTRVIRSVPALDAAAVSAVSRWRFTPAIGRSGRSVRVILEIPVQFSLK